MKYPKLSLILGLASIELHSNVFGKNSAAKFDEEALQKIEDGLAEKDTSALTTEISTLKEKVTGLETSQNAVQTSVNAALALNGIKEDASISTPDAIAALGVKCKEFGDSNQTHSITQTDGIDKGEGDGLVDGYYDPKDAHNQI